LRLLHSGGVRPPNRLPKVCSIDPTSCSRVSMDDPSIASAPVDPDSTLMVHPIFLVEWQLGLVAEASAAVYFLPTAKGTRGKRGSR